MKRLTVGVVAALVLVALLFGVMGSQAQAQERAPAVEKQRTLLLHPAAAASGAGTAYTASPRELSPGVDASAVAGFANVDIFATVDISDTGNVTLTVQFSADGTNWADYTYSYASNTSSWESEGITSTATASTAIAAQTPKLYFAADGTQLLTVPTAGEFVRVKMERNATMTPTIYVTYRN